MIALRAIATFAVVTACTTGTSGPAPAPAPTKPAPQPSPVPVAVWRATLDGEQLTVDGDTLLASDGTHIVDYAATTGVRGRVRDASVPGDRWQKVPGGYLSSEREDLSMIRDSGGALSVGWKRTDDWWPIPFVTSDSTVWGVRGGKNASVLALDLRDGSTRWKVKLPYGMQGAELGGDATTILFAYERYLAMPPGPHDIHRIISAYDAAAGATRWQVELPDEPNAMALGTGGAIVATPATLELFDGPTGKRTSLPFHQTYPSLLVQEGVGYVVDDTNVSAYVLRDGRRLWQTPREVGQGSHLVVHGELLVLTTAQRTALALDRVTGQPRWEVGTGVAAYALSVTDHAVVMMHDREAAGFALPSAAPALETARIRGHVRSAECMAVSDATIRIGDQSAKVDRDGNFTATITAAGFVTVVAPSLGRTPTPHVSSAVIQLAGKHDYATPDLDVSSCSSE